MQVGKAEIEHHDSRMPICNFPNSRHSVATGTHRVIALAQCAYQSEPNFGVILNK